MKISSTSISLAFAAVAIADTPVQRPIQDEYRPRPLVTNELSLLGFGTWRLTSPNTSEAVSWAIQTGYRHIDCAVAYGNQEEVGRGIADGLAKTGLKREDLWITSKLWNNQHGSRQSVEDAIHETLAQLQLEYLDLWHMHWPVAEGLFGKKIEYLDTWEWMVDVAHRGYVRHLGVSNFAPEQLEDLLNHTAVPPQVHQMESHPYLQQNDWLKFHEKHGIHVTAYSPLAGTNPTYKKGDPPQLLANEVVSAIAAKRGCSTAQVALKWGLLRGTSVIPKSDKKSHISDNFDALKCPLRQADVDKIDELTKYHHRYSNPGKGWGVELYSGLEDSRGHHKLDS